MRNILFHYIHTVVTRYPFFIITLSLLSAAILGGYGSVYMEMVTDQDKLLSEDLDYHHRYEDFKRRFGDLEFLYVLIEGGTEDERILFASRIENQLRDSTEIQRIVYKFDRSWMKPYALYYAPQDEINRLQNEIISNSDDLQTLKDTPSIDHILHSLSQSLSQAPAASPSPNPPYKEHTNHEHTNHLDPLLNALRGNPNPSLHDLQRFENDINQEFDNPIDYQWLSGTEYLLMLIMPNKDFSTLSVIEKPIEEIRTAIRLTKEELPTVNAGLTGRPALQADEMRTTNNDMARSGVMALISVLVLFTLFFREITRPVLTVTALLIAMGWTYGFVALTLGHLNLLSLVFALVLIGLGVDFGIHFLHRYQEELEKSKTSSTAVLGALHGVGGGIITGALTSSVAFLLALFTDFLGLAELGYVAGCGIIFCLIAMLVTLPSFLFTYDRHFRKSAHVPNPVHLYGLRHISTYPRTMVILIYLMSALLFPYAMQVRFDDNLLALQAEGLESVEYEHKIMENTEESTWYCAYLLESLDEIPGLAKKIMTKPSVSSVSSIADVLPQNAIARQTQLHSIHDLIQPVIETEYTYTPNPAVTNSLRLQLSNVLQAEKMGMTTLDETQKQQLTELNDLLADDKETVDQRLIKANNTLLQSPRETLKSIALYVSSLPPAINDIPDALKSLYVGNDGSLLVMAFPKNNIWESEFMAEFIRDVRDISPDVTGTPIQVYESSFVMRDAFSTVGLYSIAVVAVFVFIDFMTLRALFFVMVPLLMGVLWLVQIMGFFGVHLNLANFFAIPILIGIGVDNAVHLYHRYEETRDVEKALYTTGTTLTLTTLTTMAGFGSLIFASHKGLASLGALMAMGSATCWFACVIFMPALIQSLQRERRPWNRHK